LCGASGEEVAHRKPTDVLEISYGAPETSREFEKIIRK
jgi:hypothetical protein